MKPPSLPTGESRRLEALRKHQLLDTLPEQALDDLTALAAHICETPIALISLIDQHRQWFKSKVGLSACETPRDISFCGHAILGTELFIVPDTANDERFADNPLVTGEPHIRFYAGAPLLTPEGEALGTLCIIDRVPRQLNPIQREALRVLSRQVMTQLELRNKTRELIESEDQFRLYAEYSPAAVAMLDRDLKYLVISRRWREDYQLGDQPLIGRSHYEIFPEIPVRWREMHERCLAGAVERSEADHFERTDGRTEWIRWEVRPWRHADGEIGGLIIFSEVITERKQAGETLARERNLLRTVFDLLPDYIYLKDEQSRFVLCNNRRANDSVVPNPPQDLIGKTDADFFPPKQAAEFRADELAVLGGTPLMDKEETLLRPDGSRQIILTTKLPFRDSSGKIVGLVGYGRDITDRKRSERHIRQLNRVYAVLSDVNQTIVREKNPQLMLQAACQIAVEKGLFQLAWIGLADTGTRRLQITAHAGASADTLQLLHSRVCGEQPDCFFTYHALQTGQHGVCNDIAHDPQAAAWRAEALQRNYRSIASLPLKQGPDVIGTFNLYAGEPDFFDDEELRLLDELALDVSFALEVSHREAETRLLTRRLALATDAASIGIWDWNLKTDQWYATDMYFTMLGYAAEEGFSDRNIWVQRVHPDDQAVVQGKIKDLLAGKTVPYEYEARVRHANGSYRWVKVIGQMSEVDEQGRPSRMIGVRMDITERKQTEQHILQLNRVYTVLSDVNQTIVREQDPQAMLTAVCQIAVEKGRFRMAWIGLLKPESQALQPVASSGVVEGYLDLLGIDLLDQTKSAGPAGRCLLSGEHAISNDIAQDPHYQPWREEALRRGYRSSAGFPLKVEGRIVGVFNLYSAELGFFSTEELHLLDELAMDISFALEISRREEERLKAEAELRWRTAFFEAQVDSSPDGLLVVDSQGRKILQNTRLNELFHIPTDIVENPDASIQRQFVTRLTKNPGQFAERAAYLNSHPDEVSQDEIEMVDGRILDRISSPVRDKAGNYYGRIWSFRDITARKQAEESVARLATAVEQSAETIVITDLEGRMLYVNPAFEKNTGYPRAEALGQKPRILQSGRHDGGFYRRMWEVLQRGEVWSGHFINRRKNGTLFEEEATISPVRDASGKVINYVAVKRDVTREKQLESQFHEAQKMEAIGRLAGGIAHDFNNILAGIFGYGYLLQQDAAHSAAAQEDIAEILKAATRAKDLVQQILTFSRQREQNRRVITLDNVIKEALKFLRASISVEIKIELQLAADAPAVLADATQVYQVALNLATNALDAMEGKPGRLTVCLQSFQPDEAFLQAHLEFRPMEYARLTVADTGRGMEAATLERIYEPFFTTKPFGKGTGLGLAVVHGIVKSHEGIVTVESQVGRGTTFSLYFPAQIHPPAITDTTISRLAAGQGQKILLLDDEPMVIVTLQRLLKRLNYQAISANQGRQALALFLENPASFDLVITDLAMPEMNGLEVARQIHRIRPELPIVLISGYAPDLDQENLRLAGISHRLDKPISLAILAETLQRVLAPA